jgi:rSAM/selenodomain-associated transferase 1
MTATKVSGAEVCPRVLGLFAKRPQPGQVKTRLGAALSAEWAARIATAFLLDVVERLATLSVRRVLAFSPAEAQSYFADIVRDRFTLIPQAEGNLGQRMAAFFSAQLHAGVQAVVLVGTDSPTLPPFLIEQAFRELEQADIVLGPATDGGYYLIGCTRRLPPLFENVAWSTSRVLYDSILRLSDSSWRLALLPPWYDVDTLDDWRMLQGHVAALRRAGLDPRVPHTERLLQSQLP